MAGRRSNGEGTIYKRKDGRYEAAAYVLAADGSRKRVRIYGKTRTEAHEKLISAQQNSQQGIPIADVSRRLDEYLDYWLEDVVKDSKKPSTYEQYAWIASRFLKPGLGAYRIDRLSAKIVREWLMVLSNQGASAHRLRLLKVVLSAALTRALREELVPRNVARLVEVPKKYRSKKYVPWTVDEARRFLAAVASDENRPLYLLLILYGLRRGEVLGLRWGDVDFDRGVIHIRNNLQRLRGEFIQGSAKTDAGNRDLPMLADVRETLLGVHSRPLAVPRDVSPDGLVFVTQLGTPRDPDGFSKAFKHAAKRHGLRQIRLHDIRHTAATMLKDLGVPAKDTQVILGHADIATTLQIYEYASLENQEEALGRLSSVLLEAGADPVPDDAEVAARCRQNSDNGRQIASLSYLFGAFLASVNNGTREGIRTPDLWYRNFTNRSLRESVADVEGAIDVWRRCWILGCVAVRVAVTGKDFTIGRLALAATEL